MKIRNFESAEKFLINHIPEPQQGEFPAELGLKRMRYILNELGNPQDKIKVIHIAGTSGKGSTAFMISNLLRVHNFKVGLAMSPHLLDVRERAQINNELISHTKFVNYLNEIIHAIELTEKRFGFVSYFEVMMAMSFHIFYRENVDYAVIETGLGGTYDGSNVISREDKLCVITRIGLDHTAVLGNTLKEIAGQKAGIVQRKNSLITLKQNKEVDKVFKSKADEKDSDLVAIKEGVHYKKINIAKGETNFDYSYKTLKLENLKLSMLGKHQVENTALALTTIYALSERDKFPRSERKIIYTMKSLTFPGRLELIHYKNKDLIVDGAHNPQKMSGLIDSLQSIFPNEKFNFLVGFKKGKDFSAMLNIILPLANEIIVTKFNTPKQDLIHLNADQEEIRNYFKEKFFMRFKTFDKAKDALDYSIKNSSKRIVVTGSLYLISELYQRLTK